MKSANVKYDSSSLNCNLVERKLREIEVDITKFELHLPENKVAVGTVHVPG